MKITKKRLLKLGFEEEMNSWFQLNPIDGYIIWMGLGGSIAVIKKQGHGEIERTSFDDVIRYGSIEKWFEEKTGRIITLPRPKKRSLKKAVKTLKKMIDLNSEAVRELMEHVKEITNLSQSNQVSCLNNKTLIREMIDVLKLAIEDEKKEAPTPEEKPIEFGCWVEVLESGVFNKGEHCTVMEVSGSGLTSIILSRNGTSMSVSHKYIKRIKSPVE